MANYPDIGVELSGHVATIEIQRPPNNFFDMVLINSIADALEDLDKDDQCRAVVLAAQGKAFCAGANFGDGSTLEQGRAAAGRSDDADRPHLHPGGAAVPLEEADRRRDPWRGGRRRARALDGGGFSRRLPGDALRRQLHAARLPSGLRPDAHLARRRSASRTPR